MSKNGSASLCHLSNHIEGKTKPRFQLEAEIKPSLYVESQLISKHANQSVDDDIHVNQDHSAAVFPSKKACELIPLDEI